MQRWWASLHQGRPKRPIHPARSAGVASPIQGSKHLASRRRSLVSLAKDITRRLGGDWHGTYGAVPGPGHSRRDRSLTIRDHSSSPDDVFIKSFAGDDELAIKQEWRRQDLLPRTSRLPTIK